MMRSSNKCNSCMEQKKLKFYIDVIGFAALDAAIFLDTHPDNKEALSYFEYYNNAKKQALKEYGSRFAPLTQNTIPDGQSFWNWATEPWPWEMEG